MVQKFGQPLKEQTMTHGKKSPVEQVHSNFCKHILGVNRTTPNILCRVELGRIPLKAVTDLKIPGFFFFISLRKRHYQK